jgi:hypothetical protein
MMRGSAEYEQGWNGRATFIHLRLQLRHRWISALLIAACVLVGSPGGASAQASGPAQLQFDIPSQPLASSLKEYSAITNLDIYYESSLVDGHRSPSIRGSFSPHVALRRQGDIRFPIGSFNPVAGAVVTQEGGDIVMLAAVAAWKSRRSTLRWILVAAC